MSQTSFAALADLFRYAQPYRSRIYAATLCSVLNKLFDVAPEILIGIAIDVIVNQEASFVARLGYVTPESQIIVLGVLTLLIWVGESISEYAYLILWRNLAQRLQADLRQDAYEHCQSLDMAFFESRSSGELVAIMNDDVNQLERFLDGGANALIQVLVTVLAVGSVFFFLSPFIAMFAVLPIPAIIYGAFFFQKRAAPRYAEVRERVASLSSRLSNNLGGIATIKAFTAEQREADRLRDASEAYVHANRRAIAISSAFIPIIRMAILAGFLATFMVGGMMALNGELNVGAYGVLVFLTQRLLWPLTNLAQTIDLYERAMASTRRILDLIRTEIQVVDTGLQHLPEPVQGRITARNLTFAYPQSGAGIQQLDFEVPGGTTFALVGTTGSGKSTLIKLILRFYSPDAGQLLIDGIPIETLQLEHLRKSIGLVSQDVFLFEGSVLDNLRYGRPEATREEVLASAVQAEAMDFISRLPQGIDTQVGERGVRLSGGQRQRLSLARALLKNPPILILDEATSAVDNETEAAIQRSLDSVRAGRTVIVIAHRLSTITGADQIAVLEGGRIVELGTHAALLQSGGRYWAQWQVQTGAHLER